MLKILKKIKFNEKENRMTNIAATEDVIKNYKKGKNKNLDYLLSKRFGWMNNFIQRIRSRFGSWSWSRFI